MKRLILRSVIFVSLIVFMVIFVMTVFRSSFPLLWIPVTILSGLLLLYFPYKKFFKKKQ